MPTADDVDDRRGIATGAGRKGASRHQIDALRVERHPVPIGCRSGFDRSSGADADIVDDDVESAEALYRFLNTLIDRSLRSRIARHVEVPSGIDGCISIGKQLTFVNVGMSNAGALRREAARNRKAIPFAAPVTRTRRSWKRRVGCSACWACRATRRACLSASGSSPASPIRVRCRSIKMRCSVWKLEPDIRPLPLLIAPPPDVLQKPSSQPGSWSKERYGMPPASGRGAP